MSTLTVEYQADGRYALLDGRGHVLLVAATYQAIEAEKTRLYAEADAIADRVMRSEAARRCAAVGRLARSPR